MPLSVGHVTLQTHPLHPDAWSSSGHKRMHDVYLPTALWKSPDKLKLSKRCGMTTAMPFHEIMNRIRRCVRNGERLHLDHSQVLALVGSPIFQELAGLEALEITQQWQNKSDLANFGSLGAQTGANGPSAGMTEPLEPAAESQLLAATATMILRRSKPNRPSPPTSQPTAHPKRSRPQLRQVSPES